MSCLRKICTTILRKKSLRASTSLETKLDRCLTTGQLIFFGIAQMAGAGIYVLSGHIIKNRSGPAANISFLIGGISSFFTAMCYCEFATLIPKAGSCYTYTYIFIGELPAFIIGWTFIFDFIISMAAIAKGFSGAVNILTNNLILNFTQKYVPLLPNNPVIDTSADLVAFALILLLLLISFSGANPSLTINSILTTMQILCLLVISVACFVYGNVANYFADGGFAPFGVLGIVQGAGIAVFAFSGFDSLANSAEETKDPKRSIPIAMFVSLSVITILYVLASSGIPFMVSRLSVNELAPFVDAFNQRHLEVFTWIAGVGTLLATGATKLACMYVIPRIIYAVSNDGLLFKFLGNVDNRTRSPVIALSIGGIFILLLCLFVKIEVLADITSMGILLSFVTVGINLIIFRYIYDEDEQRNWSDVPLQMRFIRHDYLATKKAFLLNLFFLVLAVILMGLAAVFGFILSTEMGSVLSIITITFVLIFFFTLCLYQPNVNENSYSVPLMPVTPFITITLNICLMINLPGETWIRFLIWLIIGLIIYVSYGVWHSDLSVKGGQYMELYQGSEVKEKKDSIGHDETEKEKN